MDHSTICGSAFSRGVQAQYRFLNSLGASSEQPQFIITESIQERRADMFIIITARCAFSDGLNNNSHDRRLFMSDFEMVRRWVCYNDGLQTVERASVVLS